MATRSICGAIVAAKDPKALADFYAETFELEFQREEHGDLLAHYGVDIGELHFAVHPSANVHGRPPGRAGIGLAFNVDSVEKTIKRLERLGAKNIVPLHDEGFGPVATYEDPEGNHFELVELSYEFGSS